MLLLEGSATVAFDGHEAPMHARSWLRLPPGQALVARAGAEGCRVWIKYSALRDLVGSATSTALTQRSQRSSDW